MEPWCVSKDPHPDSCLQAGLPFYYWRLGQVHWHLGATEGSVLAEERCCPEK